MASGKLQACRWVAAGVAAVLLGSCSSHVDKGDELMAQKNFYEAIAEYRLAVAQDERDPEARAKLGIAYHRVGRLEEAEAELRRVVLLAPKEGSYHEALGDVLYDRDRLAQARSHYGSAVAGGRDNAHVRVRIAEAELAAGNLKGASDNLSRALAMEPDSAEANKGMGDLMNHANAYEPAETYYRRALAVEPANTKVRNNLGLVYRKWERYDDAIEMFQSTLQSDPNNEDALRYLANIYYERQEYGEAEKYYDRILQLNPDDGNARLGKNAIRWLREQGKLPESSPQ